MSQTALLIASSRVCVTRGYWDPEESTRAKFVALGLGTEAEYNFSEVAKTLLGQAQSVQFQSEGQTGYTWGTLYQDAGNGNYSDNKTANTSGVEATVEGELVLVADNANSAIPREYIGDNRSGIATFYNYYSATAESLGYLNSSGQASDSICPQGWSLPTSDLFGKLFVDSYGLYSNTGFDNASAVSAVRSLPWAHTFPGYYYGFNGSYQANNLYGRIGTSVKSGRNGYHILTVENIGTKYIDHDYARNLSDGNNIRCIRR